ncbi:hexulose-6-phosphate isomerase [Pilibacter termitis]|uniref:L-ribulose-5-phosphate 3-epimerase n=1 Tax=Pilibacter termitis TaxID=263852 RepID=A0A1T4KVP8_9ENTE|nr:L-ribulose-5-phosphate 3-epimerase [Pilibacter termitis]SJZ46514.1 hexulose-6-phosphate isomerase [Pilibacter termitis]
MATFGIYEKALPKNISWYERLTLAKKLGFDFVEMSIDESDERLKRLLWSKEEREDLRNAIFSVGVPILSICLSGHRRFPLGTKDKATQEKAILMLKQAVDLASDLGVRQIQLAGYDVYYEEKSMETRNNFIENLKKCVAIASEKNVVLAIEIMDDPFINSITKFLQIKEQISSPYLQVYPDLGNLSAWSENNPAYELERGIGSISAIHLKDTLAVTDTFKGQFRDVPFGTGCVDFVGLLKTLKRLEYNGSFVMEMWSENAENPEQEVEKSWEKVSKWLKEANYLDKD